MEVKATWVGEDTPLPTTHHEYQPESRKGTASTAILIRCECGNELRLDPVISGNATCDWKMVTGGSMSFICKRCGLKIPVHDWTIVDLSLKPFG